jgi:hypothetical protein
MKSEARLTGSEFVARVSRPPGQRLKFGEWVELLYDVFEAHGEGRAFEDIAFEAKSFQKLTRLLATGISDNAARAKVEVEIKGALERFIRLLERGSSNLQSNEREEFRKQFLGPAAPIDNVMVLLGDFSKIKDFYLGEHDAGK